MMAAMLMPADPRPKPDGDLYRVCEPASGSGALLLAWAETIAERDGMDALRHWSFTAIDRAPDCARMTAVQLLANASIQPCAFGELLVYQGSALGPVSDLDVVVHATAATTPAKHAPPPPIRPGSKLSRPPRGRRALTSLVYPSRPKPPPEGIDPAGDRAPPGSLAGSGFRARLRVTKPTRGSTRWPTYPCRYPGWSVRCGCC